MTPAELLKELKSIDLYVDLDRSNSEVSTIESAIKYIAATQARIVKTHAEYANRSGYDMLEAYKLMCEEILNEKI